MIRNDALRPRAAAPALNPAVIASLRRLNEEGQPDVVAEVLALFRRETPSRLDAIRSAAAKGDAALLARAAHTLKGAAATIGAEAMEAACLAVEQLAKRDPKADAGGVIDAVHEEYRRVEAEIDQLL